jgi:hypothetical protein
MVLNDSENFRGKTPHEFLQWLRGSNIAITFEQTYKLAKPNTTIAAKTQTDERCVAAFRRIAPPKVKTKSVNSLLSIEKALVAELQKTPKLNNVVIEKKIASANIRVEFTFKRTKYIR